MPVSVSYMECHFPFFAVMATVIVLGSILKENTHMMEVVEESGDIRVCSDAWNFPIQYMGAAGASLPDNTITVCGGIDYAFYEEFGPKRICYTLGNRGWREFSFLQTERVYHGSSRIEKGKGIYKRLALIPCSLVDIEFSRHSIPLICQETFIK